MRVLIACVTCVLLTGCLSVPDRSRDRIYEPRKPVSFENDEAARLFSTGRRHDNTAEEGCSNRYLASLLNRPYVIPSDAGRYNDAVDRCDTNRDGTITREEATYYSQLFLRK